MGRQDIDKIKEQLMNELEEMRNQIAKLEVIESKNKWLENKLQLTQDIFYRAFYTNSSSITISRLRDGRFMHVNKNFIKITGYLHDEVIGKTSIELSIWDKPEGRDRALDLLRREGVIRNIEFNLRTKSGKYRTVLMSADTFDVNGERYIIGVMNDITERKQAEEILREREELYRTLFNEANDAIFIMENKRFVDCNEMTLRMFGGENKEDFIGHTPWDFSPPKQPDGSSSEKKAIVLINAVLDGKPQRFYGKHIRKDGTPFDADVSLNCVDIRNHKYIQAIMRDTQS
jgi:PAS domain S-box-containing protein